MATINIAKIMIPKITTRVLHDTDTVRQSLEAMLFHGYSSIPVVDSKERFVGCVTEGDFLRYVMANENAEKKYLETSKIDEIINKNRFKAVPITAETDLIIQTITNQNFIPIVDDRNVLCGILTRKAIIQELANQNK